MSGCKRLRCALVMHQELLMRWKKELLLTLHPCTQIVMRFHYCIYISEFCQAWTVQFCSFRKGWLGLFIDFKCIFFCWIHLQYQFWFFSSCTIKPNYSIGLMLRLIGSPISVFLTIGQIATLVIWKKMTSMKKLLDLTLNKFQLSILM